MDHNKEKELCVCVFTNNRTQPTATINTHIHTHTHTPTHTRHTPTHARPHARHKQPHTHARTHHNTLLRRAKRRPRKSASLRLGWSLRGCYRCVGPFRGSSARSSGGAAVRPYAWGFVEPIGTFPAAIAVSVPSHEMA